jgi:hypothetical protein
VTRGALTRRSLFGAAASALALTATNTPLLAADSAKIVVHRSPTCGCCGAWTKHLRSAGFSVEIIDEADIDSVKKRLGVPQQLVSCHTAELDGYVIEGHVPVASIQRLLAERPKMLGLAVPGMPAGSPGMEMAGAEDRYEVLLFDAAESRLYGRFQGNRAL